MTTKTLGTFLMLPLTLASMAAAAPAVRSNMLVTTDWLGQHLNDPKLVILHVSANRAAYDAGHIAGARFIPLSDLVVTRDGIPNELPATADLKKVIEAAGVSDDSRVILYGDTTVLPATRAYFTFDYLGHGDQAALLDGGLEKWRGEGRSLTKDASTAAQGSFTPRPKPDLVVQIDAVKQMAGKSASGASSLSDVLLDARSAADYRGEKGSHIPGALNVFWMDDQASRENQALQPEAELRALYEKLGVTPDRKVVTYCNTGMQASQSYFTLKYLGYDVRMYDGSMSEWTAKGAPVEK
jgi:thiosulfate/3-mercaptopyruvate sulfurtransferase